mmetsp:Transcript_5050/g.6542  ORF Transcript_5050/g.6542 Transcript_5050/m.6542 type:complete len:207 (-) Transcript_5050:362-982(-)
MDMWFWESDEGGWNPFDDQISSQLTTHQCRGLDTTTIMIAGQNYEVDFTQMIQINKQTQRRRTVCQGFPDFPPLPPTSRPNVSSNQEILNFGELVMDDVDYDGGGGGHCSSNEAQTLLTPLDEELDNAAPDHLRCPITHNLFSDPVVIISGNTFERSAIQKWFQKHDNDPNTNEKVTPSPSFFETNPYILFLFFLQILFFPFIINF